MQAASGLSKERLAPSSDIPLLAGETDQRADNHQCRVEQIRRGVIEQSDQRAGEYQTAEHAEQGDQQGLNDIGCGPTGLADEQHARRNQKGRQGDEGGQLFGHGGSGSRWTGQAPL